MLMPGCAISAAAHDAVHNPPRFGNKALVPNPVHDRRNLLRIQHRIGDEELQNAQPERFILLRASQQAVDHRPGQAFASSQARDLPPPQCRDDGRAVRHRKRMVRHHLCQWKWQPRRRAKVATGAQVNEQLAVRVGGALAPGIVKKRRHRPARQQVSASSLNWRSAFYKQRKPCRASASNVMRIAPARSRQYASLAQKAHATRSSTARSSSRNTSRPLEGSS